MREFILFPHGGSGNHGCEAIVRTTCNMLENEKTILFSYRKEEDYRYGIDKITEIAEPSKSINRYSAAFVKAFVQQHLFRKTDAFDVLSFSPVVSRLNREAVLVSIGGDNYCYGENEYIYMINCCARKKQAKTVLWGCSVEPDDISDKMAADLSEYDLIVARESLSYEALKSINPNTVLRPDPAFTMSPIQCDLPSAFHQSKVIGLNLSPLIIGSEKASGITFQNYVSLINYILEYTTYSVALIPHVVWSTSDDRMILRQLKAKFSKSNRIELIEDRTAPELKYIISQCSLFIGARTHATIAAYSSCVPTLVVGYSVKAKGIAKDIFGSYEKYVLPVQNIEYENQLTNAFRYISDHQFEIKKHLQQTMPTYIQSALEAGKLLTEGS